MELVKDKNSTCENDEDWTRKMDRGGLWYVKETTFQVFCAIENRIRALLNALKNPSSPSKAEIIECVTKDNDVRFY